MGEDAVEGEVRRLWRRRSGGKGDVDDDAWREIVTRVRVNKAGIAVEVAKLNNDIPIPGVSTMEVSVVIAGGREVSGSGPRRSLRVAVLNPFLLPI